MAAQIHVNPRDSEPLLLSSIVDRGAALQPDNLIVTKTAQGYHTVTFLEHLKRSKRLASALSKWGVKLEDRVGTLMWNTGWHFECYHAIPCMGAVLHTLNLRLGPADLGYIIQHAQDRVIIADADLLGLLCQVGKEMMSKVELLVCVGEDGVPGAWKLPAGPGLETMKVIDYEAFLSSGSEDFVWPSFPETTTMGLCYTSGTTGKPKGAAYSHRSTYLHTLILVGADMLGLSGTQVVLPFVPMFHVLSWGMPFGILMTGARPIFNSRWMDPGSLLKLMIDWKVQLSTGVPTVWQGVRALIEKEGVDKVRAVLKLQTLTCGGSAPPAEMMRWYLDKLGIEFIQGWGMTETNPLGALGVRVAKVSDLDKSLDDSFKNVMKAGLPMPGVQVRIADSENLSKDVPAGEAGELLVRGPWIIQEYFQVDAPDKFHNGWLITGDVAKVDSEGAIIISDRSKDVIKSGGEWISSIDLENLITSMPGVAMAAVVAVPHPKWDERPVAIVMLAPDASKDNLLDRVHAHCSKNFAKFQLPDDVLVWKEIPLTSTGKLDKKVIRAKLEEQKYVVPSARTPESKL